MSVKRDVLGNEEMNNKKWSIKKRNSHGWFRSSRANYLLSIGIESFKSVRKR